MMSRGGSDISGPSPPYPSTQDDDRDTESAVLHHLLEVRPTRLTVAELIRELAGAEEVRFDVSDAIERAVRDLSAVGLIHLQDGYVDPIASGDPVRRTARTVMDGSSPSC